MSDLSLSLKNISKHHIQGSICVEVLKNVNLDIKRGEIVAIIGASGSGKSTLLQIAGLLDSASSGKIYIAGEDISLLSDSQKSQLRLKKIGFVYQYHHLLKDFSARENIAMPALIAGENYAHALTRADEFLVKLQMEKRRFHFPGQLSGGEQQRVAIGRAMFNNPEIILADEPTGNLDAQTGDEVFQMFLELAKLQKTSIILVTHNQKIADNADRVILISEINAL